MMFLLDIMVRKDENKLSKKNRKHGKDIRFDNLFFTNLFLSDNLPTVNTQFFTQKVVITV